jgi:hypothetical protein
MKQAFKCPHRCQCRYSSARVGIPLRGCVCLSASLERLPTLCLPTLRPPDGISPHFLRKFALIIRESFAKIRRPFFSTFP